MLPQFTPEKLTDLSMNFSPFPILQAIQQGSQTGGNFVASPGPAGQQPMPEPGTMAPFLNMVQPQQEVQKTMAGLSPESLARIGAAMPRAPGAPSPGGMPGSRPVQIQPPASGAVPRSKPIPTLAQLIGG